MSIKVYDNFLEKGFFLDLQTKVMGDLLWYYNPDVLDGVDDCLKDYQLTHSVYKNDTFFSQDYAVFFPLLNKINPFLLHRVKVNCNLYAQDQYEHGMHIDVDDAPENLNIKTAIFYINSNDGYTKFESTGEKIDSVENRLVVFDYKERHTGSTPTNAKARFLVNINYVPSINGIQ